MARDQNARVDCDAEVRPGATSLNEEVALAWDDQLSPVRTLARPVPLILVAGKFALATAVAFLHPTLA